MPTTSLARERSQPEQRHAPQASTLRPLRVGVLGISSQSPSALIEPLSRAALPVHAISIHLGTAQSTADGVSFTRAILDEPLDGLVIAGAPAEREVAPEALAHFRELTEIMEYARGFVPSTLGLGTGGLLLSRVLGLEVASIEPRIHGLVPQRVLRRRHALFGHDSDVFFAIEDRSLRITDESVDQAVRDGRLTPLAHSAHGGVSIFESADGRCVGHLGHPERKPARPANDLRPSAFYDAARESARAHAAAFFEAWVARVHELGRRGRPGSRL